MIEVARLFLLRHCH